MSWEILKDIIDDFSPDKFIRFFREKNRSSFVSSQTSLDHYNDADFIDGLMKKIIWVSASLSYHDESQNSAHDEKGE